MLDNKNHEKTNFEKAMKKADEFNYDKLDKNTKIPLGIFYQKSLPVFEDQHKILKDFKKTGKSWKNIKR